MNNRLKSGGRAKGTPNTITKIQREFVKTLLDNQSEKIVSYLFLNSQRLRKTPKTSKQKI